MMLKSAMVALLMAGAALGAPFDMTLPFTQPDGTDITVRLWGDEFYAFAETPEGYAVVYDAAANAYFYAMLADDGAALAATPHEVGKADPAAQGLAKHIRLSNEMVRDIARQRREADPLHRKIAQGSNGILPLSVQEGETSVTGLKIGLVLLVDFSDAVGTVSPATIEDAHNNLATDSVRSYFWEASNQKLDFSNLVVTAYIRAPKPKSYYNDPNQYASKSELVRDVVSVWTNQPDFATTWAPLLHSVLSPGFPTSVLYAGNRPGAWSVGLWPHASSVSVEIIPGLAIGKYQMTDIGASLPMGTLCHENGHTVCGFPDLYDYTFNSSGGAGAFCIMGHGGANTRPCAYLRIMAGWVNPQPLPAGTVTVTSSVDTVYHYGHPATSREYYLIENRNKAGCDAGLPGGGIAIWHIDELGGRDTPNYAPNATHDNFMVQLMQADGEWHLNTGSNRGDAQDLFFLGNASSAYPNELTDASRVRSTWWDGSFSALDVTAFSAVGDVMTFEAAAIPTMTITFDPQDGIVSPTATTVTYGETYGELPVPTNGSVAFEGWFTAAVGGTEVTAATMVMQGADHTLYARWQGTPRDVGTEEEYAAYHIPFNFYWKNSASQTLYLHSELLGMAGRYLDRIDYAYWTGSFENRAVEVWVAHTASNDLAGGWIPQAHFTKVYDGTASMPPGSLTLKLWLDMFYLYRGGNLCVMTVRTMDPQPSTSSVLALVTEAPNR
ncbi:MAG: M6 family metalloprotease domain-containing protein, partial [Kiritimatiellaeota bacterium]|nr:M6 family metalloprotease domain-containing protein [Kiritimatiellota bacterium]